MAETTATETKTRKPIWSRPIAKVAIWVCGAIAVVAFGALYLARGDSPKAPPTPPS